MENRQICFAEDLQIIQHNSPLRSCGLYILTFFQIVQYGNGKKKSAVEMTDTQPGNQG